MSKLIAALCFILAASPLAFAQEKAGGGEKAAVTSEKPVKAKKQPTEKQLAHQQKMKECSRRASDKKLKAEARKEFMRACLKG